MSSRRVLFAVTFARPRAARAAWIVGVVVSCTSASAPAPDEAPAPTPAPAVPEEPKGEWLALSDGVTSVRVHPDYVPLAEHEVERLRLAAVRRMPRADVELVGRKSSRGFQYGMTAAMRVDMLDLPGLYGETLAELTERVRKDALGELRVTGHEGKVELEPDEDGRWVDMRVSMSAPDLGDLELHSRTWASADGSYHEAGCQCAGPGCAFGDAGCVLPEPADTVPLSTPITGDQPPVQMSLADERVRVEVAPFLAVLPAADIDALVASERQRFPEVDDIEIAARIGPRDDTGVAILVSTRRCTGPSERCDAAEIAAASRTAAVADVRAMGLEPELTELVRHGQGATQHVFELRAGLLSWERRVFWQAGAAVHELACQCGGPVCATVEHSCEIEP